MAYILNIESATKNCSVSLSKNEKILALKEFNGEQYSHGELLHVFIDEVINKAGLSPKDLDAVAVSQGPGSYTGLRIGVAAAKGLCFGLNIPLIAIETLTILARAIRIPQAETIVALLDARRMEVYSAVYDGNYNCVRKVDAEIIDENSFKSFLNKGKVHFLGDGALKCKTIIANEHAIFKPPAWPSAQHMSSLAYDKFKIGNFEDIAYFEPLYLKEFLVNPPKKKV